MQITSRRPQALSLSGATAGSSSPDARHLSLSRVRQRGHGVVDRGAHHEGVPTSEGLRVCLAGDRGSDQLGITVREMRRRVDRSNIRGGIVTPEEPTQDPQDKAFGAAVSRDQDTVDKLEEQGVSLDEMPDEPSQHPRAGGKAEPA